MDRIRMEAERKMSNATICDQVRCCLYLDIDRILLRPYTKKITVNIKC